MDQPRETAETVLVERARQGDLDAFGKLVVRYQEKVYMVALQLVHNHSDADELSQQAFLKAFESLSKFRGDAGFFTWIYRIVVNLCLTHLKSQKRSVPLPTPGADSDGDGSAFEFASKDRVDDDLEKDEARNHVWAALDRLGPEIKAAAVLVYIQDLSPRDAGRILGCAEATVHWRLFRARKMLKKYLEPSSAVVSMERSHG